MSSLLLLCALVHKTCGTWYYCSEAFDAGSGCVTTTTRNDNIRADGYKSLFQGSETVSVTNQRLCYGVYSCANTQNINDTRTNCYARSSCSNSNIFAVTSVYALGVTSVANADITFGETLWCQSDQSCTHATVTGFDGKVIINGHGSLSLYDTVINYNIDGGALTLNLKGYFAGYKAIVNCGNGAVCTINCWYNACAGLTLNCDSITCPVINKGYNNDNFLPPNTSYILDPQKFYNSTLITYSNDNACNAQQTDKTFDNNQEHPGTDITYNTDVGPICCRGMRGCQETKITYTSATNPSVICSGNYACSHNEIVSDSPNLVIECSGEGACDHMNVSSAGQYLYCFTDTGCHGVNVRGISNVHCTGTWACYEANITSFGNDLTLLLTGNMAGIDSIITCNAGDMCNILCQADESCKNMELVCDGTCFVECNVDTECPNGWTGSPTESPTENPTFTKNPTTNPTFVPTFVPTFMPTFMPTFVPTFMPTVTPTTNPTFIPTFVPTFMPTNEPTFMPTNMPTLIPTLHPTIEPTNVPTLEPTTAISTTHVSTTLTYMSLSLFVETYEIKIEFDENADETEIKNIILSAIETTYPKAVIIDVSIENNEVIIILSISSNHELSADGVNERLVNELQNENNIKGIQTVKVYKSQDKIANNDSFLETFWWIFIIIGVIIVLVIVLISIYCSRSRQKKMKSQSNTSNLNTMNGEFVEVQNLSPRNKTNENKTNPNIIPQNEDETDEGSEEEMYNTKPTKGAEFEGNSVENEEMYEMQQPTNGDDFEVSNEEMYDNNDIDVIKQETMGGSEAKEEVSNDSNAESEELYIETNTVE